MIRHLIELPLDELQAEAFRLRKHHFGNALTFSIPGTVSYHDNHLPVPKDRFTAFSVTGKVCKLQCEHCRGKLLESMVPAEDPETLLCHVDQLQARGALGILISGGSDGEGEVPLQSFIPAIRTIKERYPQLKVICHTGLIQRERAIGLKEAGVDQILIDVIGDEDTIREVYHLQRTVEDYERTLRMLRGLGHQLAPHVIIGHHFGAIRGEWKALEMITRVGVATIVLVIIKPLQNSGNRSMRIPKPEEISRIAAVARILNPDIPIRMGCIRPAHPWKPEMEKGVIRSGINTVALPLQGTIEYAEQLGLETKFVEMCCSLI